MPTDEHCADHSAHERAINVHDERLGAHGKQLDTLTETLAALREIERQNQERIDKLDERMAEIEAKPSRRWDTLTTAVITGMAGAFVGFALAQFGIM